MITAVTAFVPIPGHPRSADEYYALAVPLLVLGQQMPLLAIEEELEACWLYQYLREFYGNPPKVKHSVSDNPKKNSLAYHIVQAQKTEFLLSAAQASDFGFDTYVWIDYGIMHVPGVTVPIIKEFMKRADGEQTIAIPGCWGPDYTYNDHHPCWRFCGGVIVVPRKYLLAFDAAMKREYVDWLYRHHNVSWEVNTMARVELTTDLPIWWYKADHDASMFTSYQRTQHADKQQFGNFTGVM